MQMPAGIGAGPPLKIKIRVPSAPLAALCLVLLSAAVLLPSPLCSACSALLWRRVSRARLATGMPKRCGNQRMRPLRVLRALGDDGMLEGPRDRQLYS